MKLTKAGTIRFEGDKLFLNKFIVKMDDGERIVSTPKIINLLIEELQRIKNSESPKIIFGEKESEFID